MSGEGDGRKRSWLAPLTRVAVSVALLALVVSRAGWAALWSTIASADIRWLAAAAALAVAGIGVRAYRWGILLAAVGTPVPLGRLIRLYLVGTFFSDFLPTGVGGDVVRALEVRADTGSLATATATVLADRAAGLLALFLMGSLALPFGRDLVSGPVAGLLLALTVAGWGGSALLLRRELLTRLGLVRLLDRVTPAAELYRALNAFGARVLMRAVAVSAGLNVLLMVMNYWVGIALGIKISFWSYVLFVPLISFLLVLPVSVSGWGVREGGYVYLLAQPGVPALLALALSMLVQSFQLGLGLIGAVLYAWQGVRGLAQADGRQQGQ